MRTGATYTHEITSSGNSTNFSSSGWKDVTVKIKYSTTAQINFG